MNGRRQSLTAPGGGGGGGGGGDGVDVSLEIARGLSGIDFKAMYFPHTATSGLNLVSQRLYLQAIYIPQDCTVTGVTLSQRVAGNYTPSDYNGVGLYSWDPVTATATLVASSTNNGTIWSSASTQIWNQRSFSTPYIAAKGLYFVGFLYCSSAQTTAPSVNTFNFGSSSLNTSAAPLVNSLRVAITMTADANTSLPALVDNASSSPSTNPIIVGLY